MESLEIGGRMPSTAAPRAARGGGAAAAALGLVSSPTSGPFEVYHVDPIAGRLKRMKCRVLTGARLHALQVGRWRVAFITLTYDAEHQWDKRHISECLRFIRRWLKRRRIGLRYAWVAEMQKRGAVHYHVVLWLPFGIKLPFLDDRGWWPHGMSQMQWARNAIGYIAKYATKGGDGPRLPKGARMYGVGGLTGDALDEARWWARPGWLRDLVARGAPLRPMRGGGWVDRGTGEVYRSPWRVIFRWGFFFVTRASGAASG